MEYKIIARKFGELFGNTPHLVRSPGRINLIGEHTDYNNGFVLPAAIDREVIFASRLNCSDQIRLYANDLDQSFRTDIASIKPSPKNWPNYVLGVVDQLNKSGFEIQGFDCVFGSDIPIGAGLSSSAAIECGMAWSLNSLLGFGIDKMDIALLAQKAEHEFAGVKCGIMDQFANLFGRENHVIRLDCRSLEYEYFPFVMDELEIILCDTRVKHSLAGSEYNTRRMECEEGVKILKKHYPEIKSLRDINAPTIRKHKNELPGKVYDRCLYVTEEIERVELACSDLVKKNMDSFGKRMYETHKGLSEQYEVSCRELDYLVDIARETGVARGARMMGGGFGGCTINLVEKKSAGHFIDEITEKYTRKMQKEPGIFRVAICNGTSPFEI
jgi:galactokinase